MFISYSWTTPEHEKWVLKLAEELASQGIDVRLDKWDLKEGHDAYSFMESMVSDPSVTKVLLICDKKYAEKSDRRTGGAGAEAQIITPELYTKTEQNKFVAVVRERDEDNNPFLPRYYKGRIFIDLSDDAIYAAEYEKLLRWAWDKPLHIRPALGKMPSFLQEDKESITLPTSVEFRRAIEAVRNSRPYVKAATVEYLEKVTSEFENLRIRIENKGDAETFDDRVVRSIDNFIPTRNELIEFFLAVATNSSDSDILQSLHRFFERLLPYTARPNIDGTHWDIDQDNYKFLVHELLLYCLAAFIKRERFNEAAFFIETEYYWPNTRSSETMYRFTVFRQFMQSLAIRNDRLELRRLSLRADSLSERSKSTGFDFRDIMTADLILYLRALTFNDRWWPETLLYLTFSSAGPLELFARCRSKRYFEQAKVLFGVRDKDQLAQQLVKLEANPDQIPSWQFERLNPRQAIQFESMATTI